MVYSLRPIKKCNSSFWKKILQRMQSYEIDLIIFLIKWPDLICMANLLHVANK
jgi:hypothetical protein